jgi:hypothetical protein
MTKRPAKPAAVPVPRMRTMRADEPPPLPATSDPSAASRKGATTPKRRTRRAKFVF